MQTEQKQPEQPKKKGGRPMGYSPVKAEPKVGIQIEVDGDYVVIRLPKKDLSRKLLADLI